MEDNLGSHPRGKEGSVSDDRSPCKGKSVRCRPPGVSRHKYLGRSDRSPYKGKSIKCCLPSINDYEYLGGRGD